jgi:type II secretory pathway pseudopilin PulG
MSGGAIAAIVIGTVVGGLVIVGILTAIAIPVFLDQREKADAAEAQNAARELATAIAYVQVDSPDEIPTVTSLGDVVVVSSISGSEQTVNLPARVSYGGFAARDPATWCVYVTTGGSEVTSYQYSTWGGIERGSCSAAL